MLGVDADNTMCRSPPSDRVQSNAGTFIPVMFAPLRLNHSDARYYVNRLAGYVIASSNMVHSSLYLIRADSVDVVQSVMRGTRCYRCCGSLILLMFCCSTFGHVYKHDFDKSNLSAKTAEVY